MLELARLALEVAGLQCRDFHPYDPPRMAASKAKRQAVREATRKVVTEQGPPAAHGSFDSFVQQVQTQLNDASTKKALGLLAVLWLLSKA